MQSTLNQEDHHKSTENCINGRQNDRQADLYSPSPSLMVGSSYHEQHSLIGVANVFLESLFHDNLRITHQVLVINQNGEVCGKPCFFYDFSCFF